MRRLIASLAVVAVAVGFSSTASAGLFHKKSSCCEPAPVCCEEPAPVCCEEAAPSCGGPKFQLKGHLKGHLKGLMAKLHAKKASCCEPAPAPCCEAPAPAPAPCCAAPAPAPSCEPAPAACCDAAAPACCGPKFQLKGHLKGLMSKLHAKKSSCCEPAPAACCDAPAPSCGCN